MRSLHIEPAAVEELGWWVSQELKTVKRIYALLDSILKTPFEGIGKPEALKSNYSGYWSRRITEEHRIVYKVEADRIIIFKLKGHY